VARRDHAVLRDNRGRQLPSCLRIVLRGGCASDASNTTTLRLAAARHADLLGQNYDMDLVATTLTAELGESSRRRSAHHPLTQFHLSSSHTKRWQEQRSRNVATESQRNLRDGAAGPASRRAVESAHDPLTSSHFIASHTHAGKNSAHEV